MDGVTTVTDRGVPPEPDEFRDDLIIWAKAYHEKLHVTAPLVMPFDIRDCRLCLSDPVLAKALADAAPISESELRLLDGNR